MVGDSAGGNLIGALTLLCIKTKVKVPDGVLFIYPALILDFNFFTPSRLIALNDILLPHSILKICLDSYISKNNDPNTSDPFLSPLLASDELLKHFPRSIIMAGEKDPLNDDSWRMLHKLMYKIFD